MAKSIGRLGYVGVGIESVAGTPVAPSVYLPFTESSLVGIHEPIEEIASNSSRHQDRTSVGGKKWSEGDVSMNLDIVNSGYLFKMAMGNEVLQTGTPNVHTFYTVASGNTPKSATIVFGRETDIEQYSYSCIDELSLEVSEELATVTASFMGNFPTVGTAQSVVTTSGTVLAFKDYEVRFGNDLTAASIASATPMTDLTFTIANNVEVIHQSGQQTPRAIRTKQLQISGEYNLFFENEDDKNAYYNLNKRAMEIKFTGNANEEIKIRVPRFRLNESEVSSGLDDFFMIKCAWVAEDVVDTTTATRLCDVIFKNTKATVY